jgi:hypothetical protein
MTAPAVVIAPVTPGAHAQENPVVEIARPVKTHGCALIWCIVVIAVGTDGRFCADTDHNLCAGRWHQGQGRQQTYSAQKQTTHYDLVSPTSHILHLPHFLTLRNFRS